jgi:LruC domain-containing protein
MNKSIVALIVATLSLGMFFATRPSAAITPVSMQLTDSITGGNGQHAGQGTINVLAGKTLTLTGPDLQAYIAASRNYGGGAGRTLMFVVDVNENASGLETSRAQGIAIKNASISATIGGVSQVVSTKYWTETQAMVAETGTPGSDCAPYRQMRYTLLGDSGSSLITGRKIGTSTFDSTLKFDIDRDLSAATAVTLNITLLKTDPNGCGDPENFYDFSGGFEDLALIAPNELVNGISRERIYDVLVPYSEGTTFRGEAPSTELSTEGEATVQSELSQCSQLDANGNCMVTGVSTESGSTTVTITLDATSTLIGNLGSNGYTIIGFEDQYPDVGDYDFNDVVVAYKILKTTQVEVGTSDTYVTSISGDAYLVARGAGGYTHRWTLGIPVPAGATLKANPVCNTTKGSSPITPGCSVLQTAPGDPVRFIGFENTWALMSNMNTGANDNPSTDTIPKSSFSFEFDPPILESAFTGLANLDPYIEILRALTANRVPSKDDSPPNERVVHLNTKNAANKPFAMEIPSDWQAPVEGVDIGLAYPEFANFVTSGGTSSKDWYMPAKSQSGKVVKWKVSQVTQ